MSVYICERDDIDPIHEVVRVCRVGGGYLRSDIDLINEVDLLSELFAGIGGQVKLHLVHQGVGLELLAAGLRHGLALPSPTIARKLFD